MVQPIVTPEAVVLDLDRASVASRTLAIALDGLIIAVLWVMLAIAVFASGEGVGAALFYLLSSLALVFAWFVGFETLMRGRTPGKAALGLRVVSVDGRPVRFQQAFLRATAGLVDFFLVPIGFVAVVAVLLSPRDQRLGDMLAGTLVLRERSPAGLLAPAWFPPPRGYEGYVSSLDVSGLDDEAYAIVRSFLLRHIELAPYARDHMATRLAVPIARRIDHTPPRWVEPGPFLMCVAAAWQKAHGVTPPAWTGLPPHAGPWGPPGSGPPRPGPWGPPPRPLPPARPDWRPPPPGRGPQHPPWSQRSAAGPGSTPVGTTP